MMPTSLVYGSVCSGIEAASVAWAPLGWRAAFLAEIEAFPRAVLRHHYPEVPLHGDFTTIEAGCYGPIDLLVGGTPCQSFSVAGKRLGLDDARGNLAVEFCRLAHRLGPRWLVFENVPGLLSSDEGWDFATLVRIMGECGYGLAWRVLDAQYVRVDGYPRAVPQRRKRLFVVGHLGDWRSAAAVLFEPEGMRGDPPPRRKAGQGIAAPIASGSGSGGGYDKAASLDTVGYSQAIAFAENSRAEVRLEGGDGAVAGAVKTGGGKPGQSYPVTLVGSRVRRLTPRECERLQGFPDNWTLVPYRGALAKDGPRYRAIGNAVPVNVMRWIGRRIEAFEIALASSEIVG